MRYIINIVFSTLFLLIIIIACDDTSLADVEYPTKNISYSQYIQPILTINCATSSGCHGSNDMARGYGTYDWISTNTPPFIMAGDPDNSLAYMAVTGKGGISLMPPREVGKPLSEKEVDAFKTWIEEGAKNN